MSFGQKAKFTHVCRWFDQVRGGGRSGEGRGGRRMEGERERRVVRGREG